MRESKYNVRKDKADRTYMGIVFDSAAEMKYYRDVVVPELESGSVRKCERQVKYILQPAFISRGKKISAITYVADFVVEDKDGHIQVIDIKGCPDSIAKIKRKLFLYKYPEIDYVWLGHSKLDGGWVEYEKIQEGRKRRKKEKNKKER